MAEIKRLLFLRHLRAEASSFVLHYRDGELVRSGRGLTFWFLPLSTSVAEVPVDDRELPMQLHGRSSDYQEVHSQGVLTYRVVDPETLAERVDFGVDLTTGKHIEEPLERLALSISQLAAQLAQGVIATTPIKAMLESGCERLRDHIEEGLRADDGLRDVGVEIVSVRIGSVLPAPDVERALEAPTREHIQQSADEAAFARRAMAVEKERAIQENELKNRIELAKKQELLIAQQGQNTRREATEKAEADRIGAEADGEMKRIQAEAGARDLTLMANARTEAERLAEAVHIEAERARMEIARSLPTDVLYALAARELASKLEKIDHLNISPEVLGPMLSSLVAAGTRRLEG
ncbi:MAG: band 7 protein [Sandaracinaceae bacterium]|nr:band 7 protein [Sandaracinaceae bacterium]